MYADDCVECGEVTGIDGVVDGVVDGEGDGDDVAEDGRQAYVVTKSVHVHPCVRAHDDAVL